MESSAQTVSVPVLKDGWLMGKGFDYSLIAGTALLALTGGMVSTHWPSIFYTVMLLDLWLLGYHHVIATFTRLTFDLKSFKEYQLLVWLLPMLVAVGVVAAVWANGAWILATTYLYWQWFHYMRQSYGIARVYQRKGNAAIPFDEWIMYSLPVAGILYRSYQNPGTFLGLELKVIPVPYWLYQMALVISLGAILWWLVHQIRAYRNGQGTLGYTLFMMTHFMVFGVGYLLIEDINYGWLAMNIWHNAQYILFVWMYNNKRFKGGIDPNHRFFSMISQTKNQWLYYLVCLGISTVMYFAIVKFLSSIRITMSLSTFPMVLIIYQTINFHHYIVDGIIWKVRKQQAVRETIGIA